MRNRVNYWSSPEFFFLLFGNLLSKLLNFFPFWARKFLLILQKLFEGSTLLRYLRGLVGRKTRLKCTLSVFFVLGRLLASSVFEMSLLDVFIVLEPHGELFETDFKLRWFLLWIWVIFAVRSEHLEKSGSKCKTI